MSDEPSPYGCTPALLEAAVKAAVKSEANVLPVTEALRFVLNDADGNAQAPAGNPS